MDRTGRLMKSCLISWSQRDEGQKDECCASIHPSSFIPHPSSFLAVLRLRRGAIAGLDGVVHRDRRSGSELEYARGDNFLAGLDSGEDGDLIAARAAEFHELLAHASVALAVRTLHVIHNEHRVAEWRIADGRD